MNAQQAMAVREVAGAVVEAVKAAGPIGAPAGVMYAAMMAQGCTLAQFQSLMDSFTRLGLITRMGDCYHLGPESYLMEAPRG